MDFVIKTQDELSKMSDAEIVKYQADLESYRTEQTKGFVSETVKEQFLEGEKTFKEFLATEIKNQLAERTSKGTENENGVLAEFHKGMVEKDAYKDGVKGRVTIKAAALMTTANVIPNIINGFNQLFGNYVDPNIYTAPKQDPFILPLVDVQFVDGTESIWYVEGQLNPEGNANLS